MPAHDRVERGPQPDEPAVKACAIEDERLNATVDSALASQPVATKSDLAKMDRKLARLRRQLNELEKSQGRRAA